MLDLTKIATPFGLLDEASQAALTEYAERGGKIEAYVSGKWQPANWPNFNLSTTYRAKPQPRVIKSSYGVGKVRKDGGQGRW